MLTAFAVVRLYPESTPQLPVDVPVIEIAGVELLLETMLVVDVVAFLENCIPTPVVAVPLRFSVPPNMVVPLLKQVPSVPERLRPLKVIAPAPA